MNKPIEKILNATKYYLNCEDIEEAAFLYTKTKRGLNEKYPFFDKLDNAGVYIVREASILSLGYSIGSFINNEPLSGIAAFSFSLLIGAFNFGEIRASRKNSNLASQVQDMGVELDQKFGGALNNLSNKIKSI